MCCDLWWFVVQLQDASSNLSSKLRLARGSLFNVGHLRVKQVNITQLLMLFALAYVCCVRYVFKSNQEQASQTFSEHGECPES